MGIRLDLQTILLCLFLITDLRLPYSIFCYFITCCAIEELARIGVVSQAVVVLKAVNHPANSSGLQ